MALHFTCHFRWQRVSAAALTAVCAASLLCTPACAERKSKPVKESRRAETRDIESLEQKWRSAVMSGDTSGIERLLADDFLAISARGTLLDKQQYLHRLATHATQFSTFDLMDLKVRVQPGAAVAVSQAHINGMLEGRPIEGVFRYTKVYTRAPGGSWQMTNFEATRVSRAVSDGDAEQSMPYGERPAPSASRTTPPAGDR